MTDFILDITTVITLITDITQDHKKTRLYLEKVNPNDKVIKSLLEDDEKDSVSIKILKIIGDNKIFICKTAWKKLNNMLKSVGSNDEIERYDNLLKKLEIIDDEEDETFYEVKGKIWNEWTKTTYETASSRRYTLLTGNIAATKSAYENGYTDIDIIVHRSRCLFARDREKSLENLI